MELSNFSSTQTFVFPAEDGPDRTELLVMGQSTLDMASASDAALR